MERRKRRQDLQSVKYYILLIFAECQMTGDVWVRGSEGPGHMCPVESSIEWRTLVLMVRMAGQGSSWQESGVVLTTLSPVTYILQGCQTLTLTLHYISELLSHQKDYFITMPSVVMYSVGLLKEIHSLVWLVSVLMLDHLDQCPPLAATPPPMVRPSHNLEKIFGSGLGRDLCRHLAQPSHSSHQSAEQETSPRLTARLATSVYTSVHNILHILCSTTYM